MIKIKDNYERDTLDVYEIDTNNEVKIEIGYKIMFLDKKSVMKLIKYLNKQFQL